MEKGEREMLYATEARWYTQLALQEGISKYTFAGQFVKDKSVLEAGCENGYGASYLMSKGANKVVAGDIAKEAIEYAKAHYQKDGLHFLVLDAQQLPFLDTSFDVIVSFEVIEHLQKYEDFLNECQRLLKDGGTFVCSTPNKAIVSPNSDKLWYYQHVKEFYPDEFHTLLANYFKDVVIYGLYPTSKARARIKKVIYSPKPKVYCFVKPMLIKTVNFISRFVSPSYHSLKLEEIDEDCLDRMLDKRYQPFPLQNNPSCFGIMAVARK
jgi:2-polyprenyl-3-methyl-5-hydroxy-6-metoxy-1,4-benzoquinol methylase